MAMVVSLHYIASSAGSLIFFIFFFLHPNAGCNAFTCVAPKLRANLSNTLFYNDLNYLATTTVPVAKKDVGAIFGCDNDTSVCEVREADKVVLLMTTIPTATNQSQTMTTPLEDVRVSEDSASLLVPLHYLVDYLALPLAHFHVSPLLDHGEEVAASCQCPDEKDDSLPMLPFTSEGILKGEAVAPTSLPFSQTTPQRGILITGITPELIRNEGGTAAFYKLKIGMHLELGYSADKRLFHAKNSYHCHRLAYWESAMCTLRTHRFFWLARLSIAGDDQKIRLSHIALCNSFILQLRIHFDKATIETTMEEDFDVLEEFVSQQLMPLGFPHVVEFTAGALERILSLASLRWVLSPKQHSNAPDAGQRWPNLFRGAAFFVHSEVPFDRVEKMLMPLATQLELEDTTTHSHLLKPEETANAALQLTFPVPHSRMNLRNLKNAKEAMGWAKANGHYRGASLPMEFLYQLNPNSTPSTKEKYPAKRAEFIKETAELFPQPPAE